jgi:hypothetical protein
MPADPVGTPQYGRHGLMTGSDESAEFPTDRREFYRPLRVSS